MSAPSIFLVIAVGALEHVYSSRTNATHVKRTVLIVDGDRARRPSPLILWNAAARCELKIGDVAYASALRRAHASPRWRTHRDALVAARGCEIRAVASAEAVAGRRERRALGAEFSTKNGFDGRAAMRRTIERARREHADVLRRAVDAAEARRRESFGREAGYAEIEALDGTSASTTHLLGRVVRETIAPSSWRPRGGGRDGARYVRRIVWVVQTHGGRCVAICLPPTTEAAAAERSLLKDGAVIDVRNALVRRNARTGVCDLVCDVRSHWRALDDKDPRYADVCARAPKSAFEQTLTFEALALAMHSNGFARASSMIRFKACVRWVKVATERRRVPPMLRETDAIRDGGFDDVLRVPRVLARARNRSQQRVQDVSLHVRRREVWVRVAGHRARNAKRPRRFQDGDSGAGARRHRATTFVQRRRVERVGRTRQRRRVLTTSTTTTQRRVRITRRSCWPPSTRSPPAVETPPWIGE